MKKKVKVRRFIEDLELTPIYIGNQQDFDINTSDLNRPGLQLSGFFEYFSHDKVQLFGKGEIEYIKSLPEDVAKERLERLFSANIPCVIISRDQYPSDIIIDVAKKYDVPLLLSKLDTMKISNLTSIFLDNELAPKIARHGGLIDVYGVGIFLTGESGIGKSETALELIKRGHRMIADDVVEITKISDSVLVGRAPDVIRHLMEIRGLGLVDISVLYGMGAVMEGKTITLRIHLAAGDVQDIDRLGVNTEYTNLLGVDIPKITIPVRPGRNLAVIIEVAAMNFRLKSLGHNPADALNQDLLNLLG
ncbi:MAG: HPr(Ser) kinase/phosphatase [Clostridia bacterium]|nr:HPr(Ser) kinase/phosphatase [Clostridia bacterium]